MKRASTIAVLLVGAFACIATQRAGASTGERPVLPKLRSASMSIPWSDFKQLLDMIEPAPAKPKEERPPIDWTLSTARYNAEAGKDGSVRIQAELEIVVWKPKGWVQIPVIGDTVAPVSATLDGEETSLVPNESGWFTLLIDTAGRHLFELCFFVRSASEEGVKTFTVPCSRTPLTLMTLTVPVRDANVRSPAAASISTKKSADSLVADIVFRPTDNITVSWTLPAALRKPKPVEEARVTCLTSTLASVTERYITCESRLHYDVLRGSVDTFRLSLPRAANVLTVAGQGAAWTRSEVAETQQIEVKVNHRVADRYELVVKYETPFENEIVTVKVPELVVQDIVRETGYIGVTARGNVELNASPEVEGLIRVDISDLPTAVRTMSPNPILLAFKYTEHPYLLAMDARKLADVPVRVAGIDRAELTTVLTDEGMVITQARYDVHNNVKQFLRVDIPEDAEVWSAEVGGKVVKPARDNESATILIPLFKSVETNRRLGSFPVELMYMERIPGLPKFAGKLDFRAPAADILANEVRWHVVVPESQRVYRSQGDLKPLEMVQRTAPGRPTLGREAAGTRRETAYRLREGVERFLITDMNNPAASAAAASPSRSKRAAPRKAPPAPADVAVAGVLPVQIDLPVEGIASHFKRTIVPQGKSLELSLYTYNARLRPLSRLALLGLGILIGLSVGRLLWLRLAEGRAAIGLLVAAIVCAVPVAIIAAAFRPTLGPAYAGIVGGMAVTLLLPWVATRFDKRNKLSRPEPQQ